MRVPGPVDLPFARFSAYFCTFNGFMRSFTIAVLLLLLVSGGTLRAQYTISGKVYSYDGKEAMPFVPVFIKGTGYYAQTDFDGNFSIKAAKLGDSLVAFYSGYERLARPINKTLQQQVINFPMRQLGGMALEEVVVMAGDNPAHRIIRNCVKNKEKNNRSNLEAYEYEVYNKLEFDLNRIPKEMKEKKALKSLEFIFDNVDSTFSSERPSLPFFMVENLSNFYYKKEPQRKKEVVFASKITGVENSSISQVLGDMYQNINIYDNNLLIFNKQLPSPISENGFFYYKYYLQDSAFEGNKYIYHITFKPKRSQELSFSGNMWIADTTWGIKRLEMSLPKDANVNFINTASVIQEFDYFDSTWTMVRDRLVVDFAPTKKAIGFYGRKTSSYKHIVLNQPKDDKFYEFADKIEVEQKATQQTEEYWNEHRHDSLTLREKKIIKLVDTIQTLPIYRTWVDIFYLLMTGYQKVNNFEIGPYSNMVSYNQIEGLRLRFGGRTSEKFSKWYELNGYVAYGLKDEKWKYSLGFKSFLTKNPSRQIVGITYKGDNEILGQSENGYSQDNLLIAIFRTNPLTNLTRVNQASAYYEREWFPGLSSKFTLIGREFTALGSNKYLYYDSEGNIQEYANINNTEFRINVRLAWKEKYVGEGFTRLSLGTRNPIIQVLYAKALQNAFKGAYNYHKLGFRLEDRLRITPILGYTDYTLDLGKIWGVLPYPLMELHGGNETFIYDIMAYNMMNYYEFASDQFISLGIFHHFEGLFLNKIPLIKRLKWREVATFKGVWGSVNQQNRDVLIFPSTLSDLNKSPYLEASLGIENILKIFRVDVFWRLNYLFPNPKDNFGLRFGFQLML